MISLDKIIGLNISNIFKRTTNYVANSTEKLSTGKRINKAANDAAGLCISEKMLSQIKGFSQAIRNTQDTISLIQTAEGALDKVHSVLQRIRELAVQSANGTYINEDREKQDLEVQQLKEEINKISEYTHFNTIKLLDKKSVPKDEAKPEPPELAPKIKWENTFPFDDINYTRIDEVDFSTITDGCTIIIQGVRFEFDDDGIQDDPNSEIINITDDYATTADSLANKFNDIFLNTGEFFMTALPVPAPNDKDALITIDILSILGDEIVIQYVDSPKSFPPKQEEQEETEDSNYTFRFQVGPNSGHSFELSFEGTSTENLGINDVTVSTAKDATSAITSTDNAIKFISSYRANLGAAQNRLEHTIRSLGVSEENLSSANSRIRDCDMAKEMIEFTKENILSQVAQAMLAQSNSKSQNVLHLLKF